MYMYIYIYIYVIYWKKEIIIIRNIQSRKAIKKNEEYYVCFNNYYKYNVKRDRKCKNNNNYKNITN